MKELTPDQVEHYKKIIDKMSHIEMGEIYRYAPIGHPFFVIGSELHAYFMEKFNQLGGMTLTLSKAIGWNKK